MLISVHHCNLLVALWSILLKVVNNQFVRRILQQSTLFTFGANHLQPGRRHLLHVTVVNKRLLELIGNMLKFKTLYAIVQ